MTVKKPPMPDDLAAAVAFCFGPPLGPEHCRDHVMTSPYDTKCQHPGLDEICGLPLNHENRHHCAREGCAYEWPTN